MIVKKIIKQSFLEDVYCMNVPQTHTFLVKSKKNKKVVTHNCVAAYCFDKDSKFVLADKSEMSFEDAEKNNITEADVISYNFQTKEQEVKHAVNIGYKGTDDLYQIETEDGRLLKGFTKWHKVLTTNRGLVAFADLTDEDDIIDFKI